MDVLQHINSLFNSICYKFGNCLIDPGDVLAEFDSVEAILLTHAHFDHIYGLNELLKNSPKAKIYTNLQGKEMLLDSRKNMSFYYDTPFVLESASSIELVEDGKETVLPDGQMVRSVFTPGHNPSCITWVIKDSVFTGDSFIPGAKIVTNLPGGNKKEAEQSLEHIKEISIGKNIYPGHKI